MNNRVIQILYKNNVIVLENISRSVKLPTNYLIFNDNLQLNFIDEVI